MKKLLILAFLIPSAVFSYPRIKNPTTPEQIQQDLNDLSDDIKATQIISLTLVQINASIPKFLGQTVYCSNCTNTVICVGTATVVGSWSSPSAKGTHCN